MKIADVRDKEYTIESYVDLSGTNLTNIEYDDRTAWPEGFEPTAI